MRRETPPGGRWATAQHPLAMLRSMLRALPSEPSGASSPAVRGAAQHSRATSRNTHRNTAHLLRATQVPPYKEGSGPVAQQGHQPGRGQA